MRKVAFASILLMLCILSACSGVDNKNVDLNQAETPVVYEPVTLTINSSGQLNYAPIYFAMKEGYFEEFGITLEIIQFNKTTEAIPLLVSGQLDVYAGSLGTGLINVLGQSPYVKVVADRGQQTPGACTFNAILVRKDLYESGEVTSPEDLKGLTVDCNDSSTEGYYIATYLGGAGLTFNDVVLSDLPTAALFDAVVNKTVDVIVSPELTLSRLLNQGNVVILARSEEVVGNFQSSVLAYGKRLVTDDPEIGVRFMAAYLKGVTQYNLGKTERNLQLLAEVTGESVETVKNACWVPIRSDGQINFSSVDKYQRWSLEQGFLDQVITEEQFWDPKFLSAATQLLENQP
jgi:NitT/TauT family transport system substrate-binding protein